MDTIFGIPAALAGSVLRHALTGGAGALAAAGYLTNDEAAMVVSAGMGIAGLAWSFWEKYRSSMARKAATPAK